MLNNEVDQKTHVFANIFPDVILEHVPVESENALDHKNFALLYESYADQIYHYIQYRLGDVEAAEDLTSQVFLKAWEKRENYKNTGAPIIAWLYTIARNTVIDDRRINKETTSLKEDDKYVSEHPSPSEACELHFETQALKEALSTLTPEQYQVIRWKFIEGFSTEEIASLMGKKEGTVRALQMRALKKLSEKLEKRDEDLQSIK